LDLIRGSCPRWWCSWTVARELVRVPSTAL
jgi:hypothetical protein